MYIYSSNNNILFVGSWLDIYKKKSLIIIGDSVTAIVTFFVFLIFYYKIESLSIIFIACALRSIGAGIQAPSQNAILPSICPTEKLQKINSINATINSIMTILSPGIGGFLVSTLGFTFTLIVDIVTAIFAILIISFLKLDSNIKCSNILYHQDFILGVKYMFNQTMIKHLLMFLLPFYFFLSAPSYLSPILVERNYGGEIWRITANQISWAIGTLIGGILIIVKNRFKKEYLVMGGCTFCLGVTICLWGWVKDFYIYLILMGCSGLFFPALSTTAITIIQKTSTPEMLGKVFANIHLINSFSMLIGIIIWGVLGDIISINTLIIFSGTNIVFLSALLFIRQTKECKKSVTSIL